MSLETLSDRALSSLFLLAVRTEFVYSEADRCDTVKVEELKESAA